MSKRSIRNGEDKDPTSGEPKVHHNSADKESDLGKFKENPPAENCRHQTSRPTPASVRLESESESNGAASRTADQAKLTAEYPPSLSSIPATIYQTSELVRTDDSTFTPNEFSNLASNSPGDGETASAEAHEAKLSSDNNLQNKYCYSPLSEQGSIRLLRLMPHKDKKASIQCQLFEYPLQEQGEGTYLYEALSYVWGSENNRQPIYIQSGDKSDNYPIAKMKREFDRRSCPLVRNNFRLLITANLHTALSHLRDRFMERIIWIDAICINQEDNDEKGQQVQSMAKIYAKASRVIVWLGEAAGDSAQALEVIRKAAEEQYTNSAIHKPNQQSILTLLKRPWFQRIWVLQEVAAARHILIKCGPTEIDGYAFCSGLSALKLSYETYPDLQSLIRPVVYLIRGAVFRPRHKRYGTSRSGRFSLGIRPLGELMDMYHTREAADRRDKVYALLGMSLDDPSAAGLSANYDTPWREVFQKLAKFSLSDQISVDTWDDKEVAVLRGKARVLGKISSVKTNITQDDRQSVNITWKNAPTSFDAKGGESSRFTYPALAKSIQVGDAVCFLQGASKPSIIRPCNGYSAIIMIAVPLTDDFQLRSITTFSNDILLVWDWDVSQGKSQDEGCYECFISSREMPRCPRIECKCQGYLGEATRLWDFGLLLNGLERYEEAGKNLRQAVEVYGTALRSVDNSHGPWREANEEVLRIMDDLLIEDNGAAIEEKYKGGQTPLSWAVGVGHEAFVRLLLDNGVDSTKGADVESTDEDGRTPLSWAAECGHEAVARLLVEKGANINSKDRDGRTPLLKAVERGHEAVARLLLEKGADVETKDKDGRTPLSWAAVHGHEGIARLLLEKGANINSKDGGGQTPLLQAVERGHEAVARLLQSHSVQSS